MEIDHGDAAETGARGAGTVSAVGAFDGVHVGHRALLARVRALADEHGLRAGVALLAPARPPDDGSAPHQLTDLAHRLELLEAAGVDVVRVVPPGADADGSPGHSEDVVRDVLADLGSRFVVVGAEDGPATAVPGRLRPGADVRVEVVPLATVDGTSGPVSSTAVRALVRDGDVERAATMLGRPHELRGVVEHGDARGRTIGFPTANVTVAGDMLLPRGGVYAGSYVGPDGVPRPAAVNVGRRPTFYDESGLLLVEAHLIDFDGDLYDQRAGVRFVRRLRDEQRFAGIDALVAQLRTDVDDARAALA